ncbi:MAG: protein kinase, partial [Archangium sp.]|nr:protein kinase [Archangium sp.]
PQYMSPEQAKAIPVDVRSDIYSLGLIVYELVTGRPTFSAETPSMLMVKHVTEQPPPFQPGPLVEVPEALEQLVFHMLQKEPNDRPQTMEEVVGVLDSLWARLKSNDPSLKRVSGNYSPTATPAAPQSGVGIVRASGKVQGVQGLGLTVQSTTTGQTLTEEPVALPQRSKTPIIVMSAIVVVLLIAVGVVLLKPPAEKIVEKPIIVEKPVIIEKPVDKPVDKPPEPVKVEKVKLTFNSNADKTEIYEDDILLGTAPFTLTRDASTISTLVFKAKGFKELKRKVKFESEGTMAIELEKEGGKKGTGGSGTGKTPRGNGLADDPYSQEEELKDAPY